MLPSLPDALAPLRDLALDLRWTWSHEADALWEHIDSDLWERTHSPWTVLQDVSSVRLKALTEDKEFLSELDRLEKRRRTYQERRGWFHDNYDAKALSGVAYFSMEFGLGAALPLYAGGLGVLAGDFLKTASDLGVPAIGIGLLYQEGYFRQLIDAAGVQHAAYPYNEPMMMPIEPVSLEHDRWLRISLELPGRTLDVRVWQAHVGRCKLYLLDSNDTLNRPADRGITGKLYGGDAEMRLMQEMVLGVAGWRVVELLAPKVEICHINEGHAAFAIIERARQLALRENLTFWQALWATRAGNVFTTHTPVEAGFDRFPADLIGKYLPSLGEALLDREVSLKDMLGLGRANPDDDHEAFNMAYLAMRGSAKTFGVSKLHGESSRRIFQPLFPRWPLSDVPIGHITNGVHMPTWDSSEADRIWTEACGKARWLSMPDCPTQQLDRVSDDELWAMRGHSRQTVIDVIREHLAVQLRERGLGPKIVQQAETVFDPNCLTIGFARRFTEYKRPNLLLSDLERLARLVLDDNRPIQIVVAGKAHPADDAGQQMIKEWIRVATDPRFRHRIAFLEDYDIALAQDLVQGVDVWINTPRRPWEACGTSGMKVVVNGGLNLSVRDGWWDEAFEPDLGWAISDDRQHHQRLSDREDAQSLYEILEQHVVPEFYDRDPSGLPRAWLQRIRRSMSVLTPQFSSARMVRDYVDDAYLPLAESLRNRLADHGQRAKALAEQRQHLKHRWSSLHLGNPDITRNGDAWHFSIPAYLGEVPPEEVHVEIFANPDGEVTPTAVPMIKGDPISGAAHGYIYWADVVSNRAANDFTIRVIPYDPDVFVPSELQFIRWQR